VVVGAGATKTGTEAASVGGRNDGQLRLPLGRTGSGWAAPRPDCGDVPRGGGPISGPPRNERGGLGLCPAAGKAGAKGLHGKPGKQRGGGGIFWFAGLVWWHRPFDCIREANQHGRFQAGSWWRMRYPGPVFLCFFLPVRTGGGFVFTFGARAFAAPVVVIYGGHSFSGPGAGGPAPHGAPPTA